MKIRSDSFPFSLYICSLHCLIFIGINTVHTFTHVVYSHTEIFFYLFLQNNSIVIYLESRALVFMVHEWSAVTLTGTVK